MEKARSYSRVGNIQLRAGDAESAIESMRRALTLRESVPEAAAYSLSLGWGHFDLANALRAGERYDESASEYEAALDLWADPTVLGPEHDNVGECTFRLAEALRSAGHLAEAGPYYERSIEIEETKYGKGHEYVAERLDGYAAYLHEAGRAHDARRVEARIAKIRGDDAP
jgi:tetratricopeptide (TPR) repeat protein